MITVCMMLIPTWSGCVQTAYRRQLAEALADKHVDKPYNGDDDLRPTTHHSKLTYYGSLLGGSSLKGAKAGIGSPTYVPKVCSEPPEVDSTT